MKESTNFIKPYTKLNPTDIDDPLPIPTTIHHHHQSPPQRRRLKLTILITTFTIIIIIILASTTLTTKQHPHNNNNNNNNLKHNPSPQTSLNSTESLKLACSFTKNQDSCFSDMSSINDKNVVDPVLVFNLSLQLAITELTNVSLLPKALILNSTGSRTGLLDCVGLFDDALSQLGQCVELVNGVNGSTGSGNLTDPTRSTELTRSSEVVTRAGEVTRGGELTEREVKDVMTWISGAMTCQDTCVDGLEEMGSTDVEEVRMRVKRSNEYMSNSLAILNNMGAILEKFGLKLH